MKGSRTPIEVKTKAIEWIINGELGSKIADNLWIHESTVSRIKDSNLQEVASESKRIADLIDTNDNLQSLADKLIAEKLLNKEETVRISELVTLRESTFKQNQVIKWLASDKVDWNFTIKWES